MDKWNEICFLIKKHSKENSKEAFFQSEVVNIFEKLGWSRYRNEIETEKSLPIGANNRLRLDILISLNGEKLFAIELKRATNQGSARISQQLVSYMLQLKMKFGLFIGENIQLFYDDPNDNKHPIKLSEIEFTENNEEGLKLIEIIKRDSFDEEKLIEYCNQKLTQIEENKSINDLIDFFTSAQGNEYVLQLVSDDLKEKHSSKIIEELQSKIAIKISDKSSFPKIENLYNLTKNVKEIQFKRSFTNLNENHSKLPIGKYVRETLNELIINNLINSDEIAKLQREDYSKQTFDIQFPFLKKILNSNDPEWIRYWKPSVTINGEMYFVCSQWYEVTANNDRPYYENWLNKMKTK
jgi:hypothetical protein